MAPTRYNSPPAGSTSHQVLMTFARRCGQSLLSRTPLHPALSLLARPPLHAQRSRTVPVVQPGPHATPVSRKPVSTRLFLPSPPATASSRAERRPPPSSFVAPPIGSWQKTTSTLKQGEGVTLQATRRGEQPVPGHTSRPSGAVCAHRLVWCHRRAAPVVTPASAVTGWLAWVRESPGIWAHAALSGTPASVDFGPLPGRCLHCSPSCLCGCDTPPPAGVAPCTPAPTPWAPGRWAWAGRA